MPMGPMVVCIRPMVVCIRTPLSERSGTRPVSSNFWLGARIRWVDMGGRRGVVRTHRRKNAAGVGRISPCVVESGMILANTVRTAGAWASGRGPWDGVADLLCKVAQVAFRTGGRANSRDAGRVEATQIWPNPGRLWPNWGRHRSTVNFGPCPPNIGTMSVSIDDLARKTRTGFDRCWSNLDQIWPRTR